MCKKAVVVSVFGLLLLFAGCDDKKPVHCQTNDDCAVSEYCLDSGACVGAAECINGSCDTGYDCIDGYCKPSITPPQDTDTVQENDPLADDGTVVTDDGVVVTDDGAVVADDGTVATDDGTVVPDDDGSVDTFFDTGSLIIPMDLDYQDEGMFQAYGLVYQLLLNKINVYWLIRTPKSIGEADFTASAKDVATAADITDHGYRGGPFAVAAVDAENALIVVGAWQAGHTTAVHQATAGFIAPVARVLRKVPRIGILANGKEDISFEYMKAAGIPDSLGQEWPAAVDKTGVYAGYPDILSVAEVRGPTDVNDKDGALFDAFGKPVFCELMTMHWDVAERDEEAIAEIREYLHYPVHFFAECQSVNAVENAVNGHFLTPHGYLMDQQPAAVDIVHPYLPFSQMDGDFKTVGGSEPSYTLPEGDSYFDDGVVMVTEKGSPIGYRDVWMTGYLDGVCNISSSASVVTEKKALWLLNSCPGKISYLGGHKYSTKTPISANLDAQGTRFFLNALFEADCITAP